VLGILLGKNLWFFDQVISKPPFFSRREKCHRKGDAKPNTLVSITLNRLLGETGSPNAFITSFIDEKMGGR
jgi:hypothetical protein